MYNMRIIKPFSWAISMSRNRNKPKKAQSNAKYILWDKGFLTWRANPTNPYIYVSFSLKQFESAYITDFGAKYLSETFDDQPAVSVNLPKNIQSQYEEIFKKQWIERANIPLKFLPTDLRAAEVRNKNVVFL